MSLNFAAGTRHSAKLDPVSSLDLSSSALQSSSHQFLNATDPRQTKSNRLRSSQANKPFRRFLDAQRADSFLKVESVNAQGTGSLSLAGNSVNTANNLGNLSGKSQYTRRDTVGANSNHFFRFTLSRSLRLKLRLENLNNNADLRLLKSNGSVLQSSRRSGTKRETVSGNLKSGTYYIQVSSTGETNYTLNWKGSGKANDAGNSVGSALDAGNLSRTARSYRGKVGSGDGGDFYSFTLTETGNVSLFLGGAGANADMTLFGTNGTEVARSSSNTNGRSINQRLNPGSYTLGVSPLNNQKATYSLEMSTVGLTGTSNPTATNTPSPTPTPAPTPNPSGSPAGNPGSSLSNAESLSSATFSRSNQVDGTSRYDFYRFTVNQSGVFTGTLSGLSGDADVRLIQDANNNGAIDSGEVLAWQWEWGTTNETIRRFLQAGTYYVQVAGYGNQTVNYSLNGNFTSAGSDDRKFSIQLNYGSGLQGASQGVQSAIEDAAKFWEKVISHSSFNGAHTLKIDVVGMNSQERWLAAATNKTGQTDASGRWMPVTGDVRINTRYSDTYNSNPNYLKDIVIHEFGHVLGIGTLWDKNGNSLIDRSSSTYRSNTYAAKAYAEMLGNANPQPVPIEPQVFGHWDENKFGNELLTPYAEQQGVKMPLSQITIASLRDIGWNVNYGAAGDFSLSQANAQSYLPSESSDLPGYSSSNPDDGFLGCKCPYCSGATTALGLNLLGSSDLASAIGV